MPYTQQEVMQYLIGPRNVAQHQTDFIKNNENMLTEQALLRAGKLVYEHHTDQLQVIGTDHKFFAKLKCSDGVKQGEPVDLGATKYWYRAMTRDEFRHLKKTGQVLINDSYGGIGSGANYSIGYMGWNKSHDYLIQFTCHGNTSFKAVLEEKRTAKQLAVSHPKAEGGGTYGLGTTGHYAGLAGEVFNGLLDEAMISWDLVYLIIRAK